MPWSTEFETGLIDDFDFTIERSFFAPDSRYMDGSQVLLQWEGKTDNPDLPETHLWFSVGKGWESTDGGKTIGHDSGRDGKYFNRSTQIAKLIARCIDDFEIGDLLESRGTAFEAKVWEGLKFHIKSESIDYGGDIGTKSKQYPNRFLGVVGETQTKANGKGKTDARAKLEALKGGKGVTDLRSKVISTLQAAPDFSTGQTAALNIDGVSDDEEILAGLIDESGLWAEAKA